MFPPSMTRDKEQVIYGETEHQRRRQGCELQKDYTLENIGDVTLECGSILEPRDRRSNGDNMDQME